MIYQVVCALKLSRDLGQAKRKEGILEPLEKQQRNQDARFDAIWDDAMGPFQKADMVVASGTSMRSGAFRRPHHLPADRWIEAPLPTRDNFFGTIQRKETIEKLTGA